MSGDRNAGAPALPALSVDDRGIIIRVNAEFEQAFGWSPTDLVGKSLTVIIPENLRDAHNMGFSRFLVTGRTSILGRPLTLKILTKNGQTLDAEHLIGGEQSGGRWVFHATLRRI